MSRKPPPPAPTRSPAPQAPPARWERREWLLAGLLAAATLLTFSPVLVCGFVDYDDPYYLNAQVRAGLTWEGVSWAWGTFHFGNWHPLVWLSLMLDEQLLGPGPFGFHLTNLLLHTGSVLLLFAALRRMTAAPWPSALAAALFALHPLNVEPVAWVAERKGVLSTFFWMLTLWAYARYAERPGPRRYALVLLAFVAGLLCKPMLLTLPVVLLLLDYWPLRRWGDTWRPGTGLLLEKLPLVAVAAAFAVIAVLAQRHSGALRALDTPTSARLGNAAVSYVWYLARAAWPADLAAFYPYRGDEVAAWQVAAALVLLAAVTLAVLRCARSAPYLAVGWLWYLVALAPVSGALVQVGAHGRADRYAYVPLVGIDIMVAWGTAAAVARWHRRALAVGLTAAVLACCAVASWTQSLHWRDSRTLWEHALQVTDGNYVACYGLGNDLHRRGEDGEALEYLAAALRIKADYAFAHSLMGNILARQGKTADALPHLQKAVRLDSNIPHAHRSLGLALLTLGRPDEAAAAFREAVRAEPSDAGAHTGLGRALLWQGRPAEALGPLAVAARLEPANRALAGEVGVCALAAGEWAQAAAIFGRLSALQPNSPDYHAGLGLALYHLGRSQEARPEFEACLRLAAHWPEAVLRRGWELATDPEAAHRCGALAVVAAEEALQARGGADAEALDVLAAADAEAGRFALAVEHARRARALAAAAGQSARARDIEDRLRLYEKGRPFHAAKHPPPG
jgi:tetratricopeptide (TPR) repeat protein